MKDGNWVVCVLNEKGSAFNVFYNGSDKGKAREVAAKTLADGEAEVFVFRVSRSAKLTDKSLRSELPKDAF